MPDDTWTRVDAYLTTLLVGDDDVLAAALRASAAAGLPAIAVSPPQGKLLHLLARIHGARNILEIGTLAGYSTIWLARALSTGGRVITLEAEQRHADVARANIERAGLGHLVEIRVGRALESLPLIAAEQRAPFDFVFIDADKPSTPEYFRWAVELSRPGSVIVVDNVVEDGAVADASSTNPRIIGMRAVIQLMGNDPRVSGTVIQTVGSKGYDGFAIAVVGSTR